MDGYSLLISKTRGNPDYLREPDGAVSRFPSFAAAQRQRELCETNKGKNVLAIVVVRYPAVKAS